MASRPCRFSTARKGYLEHGFISSGWNWNLLDIKKRLVGSQQYEIRLSHKLVSAVLIHVKQMIFSCKSWQLFHSPRSFFYFKSSVQNVYCFFSSVEDMIKKKLSTYKHRELEDYRSQSPYLIHGQSVMAGLPKIKRPSFVAFF